MASKMMLTVILCAAVTVGIAATREPSATTMDRSGTSGMTSETGKLSTSDFVTKIGASDMYEIEAARIALTKTTNPEVRAYAELMQRDHSQSASEMKTAISTSGQTNLQPPATLPPEKQSKLDNLRNKSVAEFDRAYIEEQIRSHQTALNLLQNYSQSGDVSQLKSFAATTVPTVQQHLQKAQSLQGQLGGQQQMTTPADMNRIPDTNQSAQPRRTY